MKAILFSRGFKAPDELAEIINFSYHSHSLLKQHYLIMFEPEIIEFCEQRLSPLYGEYVYKGKESSEFKCGFAGAGYIRDIDTSRKWTIESNSVGAPIITYVEVRTIQPYGYTYLRKIKEGEKEREVPIYIRTDGRVEICSFENINDGSKN